MNRTAALMEVQTLGDGLLLAGRPEAHGLFDSDTERDTRSWNQAQPVLFITLFSKSITGLEKNMPKRTITGTLFVSLSDYQDPDQLNDENEDRVIQALTFTAYKIGLDGYCKAGTATVTVELDDESELVDNKAESIRAEIKKVRAESENAITRLTEKLNSLLAIAA
jgi:hypothetical protein